MGKGNVLHLRLALAALLLCTLCVPAFAQPADDTNWFLELIDANHAPELNPQEYIWSASKGKDMANFCPSKDNDLIAKTKKSLKRIQKNENVIQGALRKSGLFYVKGDL